MLCSRSSHCDVAFLHDACSLEMRKRTTLNGRRFQTALVAVYELPYKLEDTLCHAYPCENDCYLAWTYRELLFIICLSLLSYFLKCMLLCVQLLSKTSRVRLRFYH